MTSRVLSTNDREAWVFVKRERCLENIYSGVRLRAILLQCGYLQVCTILRLRHILLPILANLYIVTALLSTAMHKPLLLLTLIPTVFTFVAVVLINIGGVDTDIQDRGDYLVPEQNQAFNLVNVRAVPY